CSVEGGVIGEPQVAAEPVDGVAHGEAWGSVWRRLVQNLLGVCSVTPLGGQLDLHRRPQG
ncbi:MAG: hypothetical protein WCK17_01795, partial [Verrucomicrobiota bacterium]